MYPPAKKKTIRLRKIKIREGEFKKREGVSSQTSTRFNLNESTPLPHSHEMTICTHKRPICKIISNNSPPHPYILKKNCLLCD